MLVHTKKGLLYFIICIDYIILFVLISIIIILFCLLHIIVGISYNMRSRGSQKLGAPVNCTPNTLPIIAPLHATHSIEYIRINIYSKFSTIIRTKSGVKFIEILLSQKIFIY